MSRADQRFGAAADVRFDEPLDEFVAFLADRGLDHVEVRQGYMDVRGTPDPGALRAFADEYGVTVTIHAPHLHATLGNVNERLREAVVAEVQACLDLAAAADAAGVVVHGGSTRPDFPDRVNRHERSQAVASLRACAEHAAAVGVPLCVENEMAYPYKQPNTATPDRMAALLDDVGADPEHLKLTLDVGHAKASGVDYREFVDRFGDRIHVAHLHDNDGTADDHDPLADFRSVAAEVGAPYNVLEMRSWADIQRCVAGSVEASVAAVASDIGAAREKSAASAGEESVGTEESVEVGE